MKNLVKLSISLVLFPSWMPLQAWAQTSPIVGSFYVPKRENPGQIETLFTYKDDGTSEVSTRFGGQRDLTVGTYEVDGNTLRLGEYTNTVSICSQSPSRKRREGGEEYKFKILDDGSLMVDLEFFKVLFAKATPEQITAFESTPLCK